MWNRSEIKQKGKESFKANYWKSVVVAFIYYLFFVGSTTVSSSKADDLNVKMNEATQDPNTVAMILLFVLGIFATLLFIMTLVDIFLLNPLQVGCDRFFVVNQYQGAELNEMAFSFKNNYWKAVAGLFLKKLLISIGTLLFIIPGIILSYSYRMVPYIIAEDRCTGGIDALR